MAPRRDPKEWLPRGKSNVIAVVDFERQRFSPFLKDFLKGLDEQVSPEPWVVTPDFVSRDGWKWWSWYDVRDMLVDAFGEGSPEVAELHKISGKTGDVGGLYLGTPPEDE